MRLSWAGQAVLSGLVAIVTADVLPPDDIPLMCVTICGPIVELTSKCDVHGQRLLKRTTPWVPKLAVEPLEEEEEVVQLEPRQDGGGDDKGLEKRSFSIIRAAPTSFPFELTATAPLEAEPSTSSVWSVETAADQVATLSTRTSTTTSFSSSSRSVTSRSTTTVSLPTTRSVLHETVATTSSAGWSGGEQTGQLYSHKDPEQECVCNNDSFDVAKIAALCHDCIVVDGHKQNNMDMIMKACNFTDLAYTPDEDSAADNIRVEATRPTALASTEAPSTNTGAGVEPASQRQVLIVGFLLGLALVV